MKKLTLLSALASFIGFRLLSRTAHEAYDLGFQDGMDAGHKEGREVGHGEGHKCAAAAIQRLIQSGAIKVGDNASAVRFFSQNLEN